MNRINFMGVPIDAISMEETVRIIVARIERRELSQHVAINPGKIIRMMEDPNIRKIVRDCEVISADGIGVVWFSRLLGDPIPERVTGIELMDRLLAVGEKKGLRPYFLGAKQEVVEGAVAHYRERFPNLRFAGYRNGYFSSEEEESIAEDIRASEADMLFVAISSPKKEEFLGRWRDVMKIPYIMGVGGSFDVVAGKVQRAPAWMQRAGLEWSYRWIQEPKRMLRRNLVDTPKFVVLALASKITGLEVPE
ncbi:MAG: WecB/TagA/CpsF family glycosyltransferase [Myxococcota bacterium]|nr:WecB/TagA/CpsF family glycosyltransferase [Myxococcota bacterium]